MKLRAWCSDCRKLVAVRLDGNFWLHGDGVIPCKNYCPSSGEEARNVVQVINDQICPYNF